MSYHLEKRRISKLKEEKDWCFRATIVAYQTCRKKILRIRGKSSSFDESGKGKKAAIVDLDNEVWSITVLCCLRHCPKLKDNKEKH